MKFKITFLLFFFLLSPNVLAQTADLGVTIAVQSGEKDVKVTIKNNTDIAQYKITTSFLSSNTSIPSKSGTFDTKGESIFQNFTNLTPKTQYGLTIQGVPVSGGNAGNITKSYTFVTNSAKPNIIEVQTASNPNPAPVPLPPAPVNDPNANPNINLVPPVTMTTPGTVLTPEQVAADKKFSGLVPCTDTCDFNDVLRLVNKLIEFLITTIFIPIIIILFMYAGYKYITAEGNPSKVANLKKMIGHIVVGMLLVLCSWLIVKTLLTILTSDPNGALQFLK